MPKPATSNWNRPVTSVINAQIAVIECTLARRAYGEVSPRTLEKLAAEITELERKAGHAILSP
jgi:hypothetical protein